METKLITTTMTVKTLAVQKRTAMEALVSFHKESDNGIAEIISFPVPKTKRGDKNALQLPLGKTLRGSMLLTLDPDDEHYVLQGFRIYRKNTCKRTATIHETRYSRVIVSNTRVTVSMSFPLTDDPTRLTARLQNFANAIVDESDEIAAMLNQEGTTKVQDAWKIINKPQTEEVPS
jgi:hypothetical protein